VPIVTLRHSAADQHRPNTNPTQSQHDPKTSPIQEQVTTLAVPKTGRTYQLGTRPMPWAAGFSCSKELSIVGFPMVCLAIDASANVLSLHAFCSQGPFSVSKCFGLHLEDGTGMAAILCNGSRRPLAHPRACLEPAKHLHALLLGWGLVCRWRGVSLRASSSKMS